MLMFLLSLIQDIGSTTLLVGVTMELRTDAEKPKWAFICASVGDCKAFLVCGETGSVGLIINLLSGNVTTN